MDMDACTEIIIEYYCYVNLASSPFLLFTLFLCLIRIGLAFSGKLFSLFKFVHLAFLLH